MIKEEVFTVLAILFLVVGSVIAQQVGEKKLTFEDKRVEAVKELQEYAQGVDVQGRPFVEKIDEASVEDIKKEGRLELGKEIGFSIIEMECDKINCIATSTGGKVRVELTEDGFTRFILDEAGYLRQHEKVFRALYPGEKKPRTSETILLEITNTGTEPPTKTLIGGAEAEDGSTEVLVKQDKDTGETIIQFRRDTKRAEGVEVDPSATFPITMKFCDENRENCVTRKIIKKPGDEIRYDPKTREVKVAFNKRGLSASKKEGNFQKLSWDCVHDGIGFKIIYPEGYMGGDPNHEVSKKGTLECNGNIFECKRGSLDEKCHFDKKDYLKKVKDFPVATLMNVRDAIFCRGDSFNQGHGCGVSICYNYDEDCDKQDQTRIKKFENFQRAREIEGDLNPQIEKDLRNSLCKDCSGKVPVKIVEYRGINDGIEVWDERTITKIKGRNIKYLVLKENWGSLNKGDVVGAFVEGGAEVSNPCTLADTCAPDILEQYEGLEITPEIQREIDRRLEEERKKIRRVRIEDKGLVIFNRDSSRRVLAEYGNDDVVVIPTLEQTEVYNADKVRTPRFDTRQVVVNREEDKVKRVTKATDVVVSKEDETSKGKTIDYTKGTVYAVFDKPTRLNPVTIGAMLGLSREELTKILLRGQTIDTKLGKMNKGRFDELSLEISNLNNKPLGSEITKGEALILPNLNKVKIHPSGNVENIATIVSPQATVSNIKPKEPFEIVTITREVKRGDTVWSYWREYRKAGGELTWQEYQEKFKELNPKFKERKGGINKLFIGEKVNLIR